MSSQDTPNALTVRGLSKSFNGRTVLSGLELDIGVGEVHGLVGENGCGKSTFIKVLSGYHAPDDGGEVLVAGTPLSFGSAQSSYALGCRFVHQDLGLFQDMSVLDNMLLGSGFPTRAGTIRAAESRRTVTEDLDRVGLSIGPDLMVRDLSPAEKTGVAVAKALRADPDSTARVLVLDEPTATLPDGEVQRLLKLVHDVASSGVGVIYVTHRLAEIFTVAKNVTVLRGGQKIATNSVADTTRAELINLMVGREFEELKQQEAVRTAHVGREVLAVDNLSFGPIRDVSFRVREGELLGIAGITGSGAETLLSCVFGGADEVTSVNQRGTVTVNGEKIRPRRPDLSISAGLAYMPPDRKISGGMMEETARENLTIASLRRLSSLLRIRAKEEKSEVAEWFDKLSVRPAEGMDNPLAHFSGGNQQKVLFAKWLRLTPTVFLIDEPTQGVDIGAKALLHRQLLAAAEGGMAVVVSSTDLEELAVLCQRVLVLRDGVLVADLNGQEVTVGNVSRTALGTNHESVA